MPPSNYFLFPTLITSRESPYQLFPEIGPKHRGLVKTPHSPMSLERGRLSVEISTGLEVARFSNVILLTCATAKLSGRHAGKVTLPIVTKRAKAPLRGGGVQRGSNDNKFPHSSTQIFGWQNWQATRTILSSPMAFQIFYLQKQTTTSQQLTQTLSKQ